MNEFLYAFAAYAVIGTAIAVMAMKGVRTQEEYYIAGRKVSGLVSALTYAATTYSAFMMVGLVGLTYASGVGALGFELFYLVGTLFLLSYYAPRVWEIAREKGCITPGDMIAMRYGREVSMVMSIIVSVALIPYISVQLIGVSLILEKTSAMSFEVGIAISAILIALWALLGGLRGVAWTDAVQGVFMLFMAIAAVFWVYSYGFSDTSFFDEVPKLGDLLVVPNKIWTPVRFIALVVPWFFFALTNPQVFQRLYIPKDRGSLRRMVILFGFFGLVYTILVTFLGLELRVLTETGRFPVVSDRDAVTPTLLRLIPPWLAVAISISIFAAAITTANSIVLTLSSMLTRDLFGSERVAIGRVLLLILTVAISIFALQRPNYIVELAVLSSTILLCQLPLILGVFHFSRGGKVTGIATLTAGFTTAIVLSYTSASPLGIPASVWTLMVSFAVFFALSAFEKQQERSHSEDFQALG
ncbi:MULTISPECIES: sodium:solute symporter family protein [unclassified Archaeoglobus]|jgi:SSS family solute:Na+ symporter|uniref:sodium:solute symporter family protein n=1 Tax=unclassified Archaeoglobus TaxID=2643606 RepID=UPI0025C5C6BE|nr:MULTISPECIES: sodium:solute symporter family protein [unclassified Archaeoglobus]